MSEELQLRNGRLSSRHWQVFSEIKNAQYLLEMAVPICLTFSSKDLEKKKTLR